MPSEQPPRYLTKSRFKLALDCPTKLFYTGKKDLYADGNLDDEFLQALAEGGFQVGELAKLMFPEGIEIIQTSHDEQVTETERMLERDSVTLFEAAIRHGNLFVRVDVLRKNGTRIELIEVKAKSFDSTAHRGFRGERGHIQGEMRPYLQDVAFQHYVLGLAYPHLQPSSFLMLIDKSKACSIDGLNQRFRIRRAQGRPQVTAAPGTDERSIGTPVLTCVNVDDLVDEILGALIDAPGVTGTLAELAATWAERYRADERIRPAIGAQCAKCEFRAEPPGTRDTDLRSGLHECWREAGGLSTADIARGTVLDLWSFRGRQALIERGVLRLADVPLDALGNPGDLGDSADGLTRGRRQAMQVTGQWPGGPDFFIDTALMRKEMTRWVHPLHFIDFETSRVAIPFFAGQRPYENIAFQFSHHVIDHDGEVEHRTQFLSTTPGRKPNYDFVRALRAALGTTGTVFMWSPHENTTLNAILEELEQDASPPPDIAELAIFIRSLTTRKIPKDSAKNPHDNPGAEVGHRAMVDLCRLAEKAFFHPATKGSSSIKKVLPAVMQASEYLQSRYASPIYGAKGGIPSLNFVDQAWWHEVDGAVVDPYCMLPPVFKDVTREAIDALEADEDLELRQGGAAMAAYARLQFEDLAPQERHSIEAALLRYCELDTLAMVMVCEAWNRWTSQTHPD
ncbi:DUF2779 domain-containing protein [Caenimonas sedimenti]|uniref:DUF2779 domain-containing protein n=1 Tax=Caenimonas sedimenti TaxID=2596921 RepID=A0A562ZME3_9BURK|nr:DUF2779 domain-containing protein [Caenimonas sedimenti]TWO69498.1 DUF2779 domain-containing protein [Caenimonas sedimenti]